MSKNAELADSIKAEAQRAGFVRCGIAEVARLEPESQRLDAWLADGRHGQMTWMETTAEVRKDVRHPGMLPDARSVIVMAAHYPKRPLSRGPGPALVAKYALGRDYHNVLTKRARRVASLLRNEGYRARVAVDSKPVFERAWAERAGVGFVGKNCCLIVPGIGSHALLACVVTTAALDADEPIDRRCGSCSACLDACPTSALLGPRELDARKCVSYLTIEHRGALPSEHLQAIGPWLFGCDVCQDVCPYNQTAGPALASLAAFEPSERWTDTPVERFLQLTEPQFDSLAEGSPIKRARREGLARNAAVVLGNCGDARHLPVLQEASESHSSPSVREAARWAGSEIRRRLAVAGSPRVPRAGD